MTGRRERGIKYVYLVYEICMSRGLIKTYQVPVYKHENPIVSIEEEGQQLIRCENLSFDLQKSNACSTLLFLQMRTKTRCEL